MSNFKDSVEDEFAMHVNRCCGEFRETMDGNLANKWLSQTEGGAERYANVDQ